jgi:acyl-coenzyme A synthetase/AMP-(fatty) acid ligase
VVATVPHAHSYGLESAVMLPLQHGLLLTADRPFFPADVAAALAGDRQPGILVTTPVHLRALVGDAAMAEPGPGPGPGFAAPVRAGFVLSATAPLPTDLATRGETTFQAPVFEIYGCSEAGQIATRRTIEGPVWRILDGLHLRRNEAGTWASGPHEDDVLLADEIELTGAGGFILQGRTADMVNVAGKRGSLAYLTRQLTAIEGVEDGVFLMPEDDVAGAPARLIAVAVAPRLDAATILAALRQRIDPAFLPRPLHVVGSLPRNALGKLPRSDILRLIASAPPAPAMALPIVLRIPADHPSGPGHFPGDPIVPGAVLLDELVAAIVPDGWTGKIETAKFHHPVRPGDTLTVTHRTDGAAIRFECRLSETGSGHPATGQPKTGQLVLSGALRSSCPSR